MTVFRQLFHHTLRSDQPTTPLHRAVPKTFFPGSPAHDGDVSHTTHDPYSGCCGCFELVRPCLCCVYKSGRVVYPTGTALTRAIYFAIRLLGTMTAYGRNFKALI